jgi:RNA polymerase sigma factor for flagellar operon FliA
MTEPTHGPDDLGEGATTNSMNSGPAMPPDGTASANLAAGQPDTSQSSTGTPGTSTSGGGKPSAGPPDVAAPGTSELSRDGTAVNGATSRAALSDAAVSQSVASDAVAGKAADAGGVGAAAGGSTAVSTAGNGGGRRNSFGVGQPDGVLPGDRRTADDVEAGIVALWRQYGSFHDQLVRDRLMLHYAPLVKYVAGRVGTGLPAHVDVADLVQSGIFGLADAIEKFEPERGLKFETYAMQRIRGAILDELRSQDWVPRSVRGRARDVERALERLGNQLQRTPTDAEIASELQIGVSDLRELYAQFQLTSVVALDELMVAGRGDASLAETLPDEDADDPVASLVDQDNRRQLADAIAQLVERDRIVVTLYYFENLTLAEIGRVLGVTESRVCQLHTRAVLRLRTKLAEHADA